MRFYAVRHALFMLGAGGVRREVVDRLRKQRPGILRWPAGPALRHYDWRDGVGPVDGRPGARLSRSR